MEKQVKQLAQWMWDSSKTTILTGAGVSAESGLKTFRGVDGMWNDKNIYDIACPEGMASNPELFVEFYRWRIKEVFDHEPNMTHNIIAKLIRQGMVDAVITQNVDGYHRTSAIGGSRIIELHGDINYVDCSVCQHTEPSTRFMTDTSCPECGAMMRPSIVMFGESLDPLALSSAFGECRDSDLLIVIGSSLDVMPANMLPYQTHENGGKVALINLDPIGFNSDLNIIGHKAGDVLNALYKELQQES
jgi:NAD-dependent deacetylase